MKKIFTLFLALTAFAIAQAATYTVAGSAAVLNGDASWDQANEANDMTTTDNVNYTLTISGISVEAGTYKFKVVEDHAWDNSWPSSDAELTISETAKYDIVYTFNVETKAVESNATKVGAFEGSTEKTYTVAGVEALLGSNWSVTDTGNDMTKGDDGIFRLVKSNVTLAAGNYTFKVAVNHDWGTSYPSSNATLTIDADGTYTVTFTFNEDTKAVGATAEKAAATQPTSVTFDFTSETIRENIGTALADTKGFIYNETFNVNGTTLQVTAGSAPSRIYTDANRGQNLVTYMQYSTLTFRAPEGYAITKIEFTAAGNSNINKLTPSSGEVEGMIWTGNADGVRFAQGGTSYLANAIVTLEAATEATAALPAIEYTECANIAAFNALEAGAYAKVTLTDAEIIGKSADGYSTVWIQDATGGAWIQYTSLNDKLKEGTKVNGTVYVVARPSSGNVQMKEAEDTPNSEFTATEISDYTIVEGTIEEVNVDANKNKVVKITGATLEETSATAGVLTVGDATIDVNNGGETANQQLHKIADWAKDTKLENVTIVAILVGKSATANQLLPISIEVVETSDATFDFQNNNGNWPYGEGADFENGNFTTLNQGDVVLTGIQGSAMNPSRIMKNATRGIFLQCFKENALKLTAPEGKAIVKVAVTMQSGSFDLTPSTGEIAENVWTGNATEVTFTNEKGARYIWAINVFLDDENEETVKPAAAVEVATIAEFNALENGTLAKLTLSNARVNGYYDLRGAYYVEDATGAVAIKGITLTAGKALNGYIVGTKSDDTTVDMDGVVVEYGLTGDDATTFEATDIALEGTVMAISAVGTQANYGKLITVENVTITGSGQNKTLTDADGNTIKARDLMGILPSDYTWPESASKLTGILVYNVTGWFLMPISEEAIGATTTTVSAISARFADEEVYNMQGVKLQEKQKGLNIVNGKKIIVN